MPSENPKPKIAVCLCLHDDYYFVEASVRACALAGPCFAFITKTAWNGTAGDWQACERAALSAGAEVILGDWPDEQLHRQTALGILKEKGFTYVLTPDGDEVFEASLVETLVQIAQTSLADRVFAHMDTYWKSAEYVIRPREQITPLVMLNVEHARQVHIRHYEGGRPLTLGPEYGVIHHLSYAGPDERIMRKIQTWSHKDEVVDLWYDRIWKGWDADRLMRNLHPTHPPAYGFAERIPVPDLLKGVHSAEWLDVKRPKRWPTISVVIPLCGNPDDIKLCLESLHVCQDLLHEVIVVDNASPDGADKVAAKFKSVKLIRNKENRGFGPASNQGVEASTGEVILFLNSDTVVPRVGLIRLIESLMTSANVGATGPYTNECGHSQRVEPTYTSLDTLDLFAEDFAERPVEDADAPADMLVGFCLAVRKSVLDEVGGFDEGFGLGTFEDNDLCYRIRRAGYRLAISSRSFVHHFGSRTLHRLNRSPFLLLAENERRYRDKWREDLECGYASHLAGLVAGQIVFNPNRSPEKRAAFMKQLAKKAGITLCMIVRNEERVLGDCLKSALPFFSQIVVIDTGSADKTIEVAKGFGAEVHEMIWPDSFAAARNESLKYAKGRWIFWMDADDTLPWQCGEEIVNVALNAPKQVVGVIVPVQFVEEGPGMGTRVDHVKLFRNIPGVQFEGRIHEQNLASLRQFGDIARCGAYVLHSGYDISPEGQKKKRERDDKLLKLDLAERPNHPFVLFNLGMTAHYSGEHKEAIKWLDQSLAAAEPTESHVRKAYVLKGVSERKLGKTGESLSTLLRGIMEVGEDPELRFQAAILLAELGRVKEAKAQYLAITTAIDDHFSSVDIGILGAKRFFNLGALCMQEGDYPAARDWWLKAIEDNATFIPAYIELFNGAVAAGDLRGADEALQRFEGAFGKSEEWLGMSMQRAAVAGGPAWVDQFLLGEIQNSPRSIRPRLALARKLLQEGREREATPQLEELVQMGCAEAAFFLGVAANRQGKFDTALSWMEHSLFLNPDHPDTRVQVENLRRLIADRNQS